MGYVAIKGGGQAIDLLVEFLDLVSVHGGPPP